MKLPQDYTKLTGKQRKLVREEYVRIQDDKCWYCGVSLDLPPRADVAISPINWALFPPGFMDHPVHLQHDHGTGMTEGAVHSLCNAYLWQYYGR